MKQKFAFYAGAFTTAAMLLSSAALNVAAAPGNAPEFAQKHMPVCPGPGGRDAANCHARVVVDQAGKPQANNTPSGFSPAQFQKAYGLSTSSLAAIAIVDAYDHPNIKSDLDKYNSTFGLPYFPSCSSSVTTSCFQKVDQRGGTRFPRANSGWALEIALDVEVAHGVCPTCKLILVEADSNSFANLLAAETTAVNLGAKVISNSWGAGEFSGQTSYDSYFDHPGVAITFSSGDAGYGAEYPASSPFVTAVGGTTLKLNPDNSWQSETAWSGAGSGCSSYEPKPAWQTDIDCANRTVADVSADADPNTGAAVYSSVKYQGRSGWFKVGGTSLSAPLIAAVYAGAGNANSTVYGSYPYGHKAFLRDVTAGSNGSCGGSYLCTAMPGYDGPTGLGTPNGYGAF